MKPSDIRSMCCRLRLDLRELRKKSGGFFGSGGSTGSVGVVTLNLPRLAYLARDKEDFYKRLDNLMDIAARSLHVKREVITKLLDNGLYPYTKRYLGTFNNHFSTIGLVGMNECCLNANWLRKDLTDPVCQEFAIEVLNYMRKRLVQYQEMYHDLYNLEATPAESTAYRLAKHDKEKYPDIITAGKEGETPYYTNSSHLPVGYTEDIFTALDIQDQLQTLYTSGTVFHCFLGEKLPDWKAAANLVKKISDNYKLPYYTMSPTYSVCREHGYLTGEQYTCPHCGQKTEVYSRITGYYRPVQNWNDGKAQEFKDRKVYDIGHSHLTHTGPVVAAPAAEAPAQPEAAPAEPAETKTAQQGNPRAMLFVSATCPNCKLAISLLEKAGFLFKKVLATENVELTNKYGVKQAPTLVVLGNGDEYEKFRGVSEIKGMLTARQAV
jgi:ribonucleoside-triphosphate reductase